jgi:choline-sulfatase
MTRRSFAGAVAAAPFLSGQTRRPNIVFLCSDQHSGRILGANGHGFVKTPHMDRLASLGVNARNCYSGSPVCVPGRASMMTGMYASDVKSYCNSTPFDGSSPTWGNRLKDAGYFCRATGKLDLTEGRDYGFHEEETAHGHSTHPDITSLFRAPMCLRPTERDMVDGRFVDRKQKDHDAELADDTIDFLRHKAPKLNQPWALYVGMHMPHPKWVASKKFESWYPTEQMPLPHVPQAYLDERHPVFDGMANHKNIAKPIPAENIRKARAAYCGMVSELDEQVGRVLDAVDLDNTLFLYTSDHGESFGENGLWLKNNLLENAARVPLLMAGAGLPKGRAIESACGHVDMVATMLELAGANLQGLRGHNLLSPSYPGIAYSESHSEGNYTGSCMVRKGDWKYIYFTGEDPLLFHLKEDPLELHNLAGRKETAAVQQQMHAALLNLVKPDEVNDRAFAAQDRVLRNMVKTMKRAEFEETIAGRLGDAQARNIASRLYRA